MKILASTNLIIKFMSLRANQSQINSLIYIYFHVYTSTQDQITC